MNAKILVAALACVLMMDVMAQTRTVKRTPARGTRRAGAALEAADDAQVNGPARDERIVIDQFPKLGRAVCLASPNLAGPSAIGPANTRPRKWIVLETKYTTQARWTDQLTFTWHVLLETKSATEKAREDDLAPYSYYSTTVTYANIPKGSHAAGVCLPPSCLERFGEPKAVGVVIANRDGVVLAGGCQSEIKGIPTNPKSMDQAFWNVESIMNAQQNGAPMIERRQGLLDRSKTIWSLVNPNDYEMVVQ